MRQVLDLLVWLVVFMVVGAVIYLAPDSRIPLPRWGLEMDKGVTPAARLRR